MNGVPLPSWARLGRPTRPHLDILAEAEAVASHRVRVLNARQQTVRGLAYQLGRSDVRLWSELGDAGRERVVSRWQAAAWAEWGEGMRVDG